MGPRSISPTNIIIFLTWVTFFWWLNAARLYSLYKILYPKGGFNLTLCWVPRYPQIKYYSHGAPQKDPIEPERGSRNLGSLTRNSFVVFFGGRRGGGCSDMNRRQPIFTPRQHHPDEFLAQLKAPDFGPRPFQHEL